MRGLDLLDELSIRIYQPPLSERRASGRIADTADPISVVMLVVDLETEVSMNGIADFMGNSTGLYAAETVLALERVGCPDDATVLRSILEVAAAAGMSHSAIQADRSHLALYEISSFSETHGDKWDAALRVIEELHQKVDYQRVRECAARFVSEHEALFLRALGR